MFLSLQPYKEQDKEQVTIQDLIQFCSIPRSRKEMQEFMELTGRRNFSEKYIKPLLNAGELDKTSVGFSDKSSVEGTKKTVKIILWKHIKGVM